MSRLFGKTNLNGVPGSPKAMFETRYNSGRSTLLMVVAFTVINIILLVSGGDSYFLFSAYVPYVLAIMGMSYTGKFPEEFYGEAYDSLEFYDDSFLYTTLAVSAVIIILYFVSWLLSKKHIGWMVFGLVFFAIDTAVMLIWGGITADVIIDIVFHIGIIISLSMGISAYFKAKKLPDEVDFSEATPQNYNFGGEESSETTHDSAVLRPADMEVKAKVFLETESNGHKITYRRVKRVNELVIDGNVYDEMEAIIESAHVLQAYVDGHVIKVGTDNTSHSFIIVDDETIARKLRLI